MSNRHCSVGKLALSARGHPAGHREVFDELNSTRWLPLIQLGLPGWQFERKKGSRKPPEGLKNAIEPSEESAVMRSKTCWMYGEGWLFYYWWPSKNVRLWLRHNEFVWELNAQSRLWKANTLCLFFCAVCDCFSTDTQMFWHLRAVFKLPALGAVWVCTRCCRSTSRHNPARNAQQLSLLTSFPLLLPICYPGWLEQGRICSDTLCRVS